MTVGLERITKLQEQLRLRKERETARKEERAHRRRNERSRKYQRKRRRALRKLRPRTKKKVKRQPTERQIARKELQKARLKAKRVAKRARSERKRHAAIYKRLKAERRKLDHRMRNDYRSCYKDLVELWNEIRLTTDILRGARLKHEEPMNQKLALEYARGWREGENHAQRLTEELEAAQQENSDGYGQDKTKII